MIIEFVISKHIFDVFIFGLLLCFFAVIVKILADLVKDERRR